VSHDEVHSSRGVRVPRELWEQVDAYAKYYERSRSALLRLMAEHWLEEAPPLPREIPTVKFDRVEGHQLMDRHEPLTTAGDTRRL
jgi:hypothetical protein